MKQTSKMIVALFLLVLTGMAASSPAIAGDQRIRVEAKQAVEASVKAKKIVTAAVNVNDKLRADLRKTGRCVGKVTAEAPDSINEAQGADLFIYSFLDAMRITYEGTRKASNKATKTLVRAAESSSNWAIVNGLISKANWASLGMIVPATNSCAVAKKWAANGYKGIRSLINKEYSKSSQSVSGWNDNYYKQLKKFTYAQEGRINRSEAVIGRVLGSKARSKYDQDATDRALGIFFSGLFGSQVEVS